jgi:hypothetical protein
MNIAQAKYTFIEIGPYDILLCEGDSELSEEIINSIEQFFLVKIDKIPTDTVPLISIEGTNIYLEFIRQSGSIQSGGYTTTVRVHQTDNEGDIELRASYETAIADGDFMVCIQFDYPHIESLHDNTHPCHFIDLPLYYRKWLAICDEQSETETVQMDEFDDMLCDAENIEMDDLFQSWFESQEYYHSREIWQHRVRVYRDEWYNF